MNGTPDTLVPRVTALLAERLQITAPDPSADLMASGHLDSLGLVELFLVLEEAFGIEVVVDELEFDDFRSVDAICGYITRTRKA